MKTHPHKPRMGHPEEQKQIPASPAGGMTAEERSFGFARGKQNNGGQGGRAGLPFIPQGKKDPALRSNLVEIAISEYCGSSG